MSWQGQGAFYFIRKGFPRKSLCLKLWKLFGVRRAPKELGYFKAGNKKLEKQKNFQGWVGVGRLSPSLPQNWRRNKNWRRKKKNLCLTIFFFSFSFYLVFNSSKQFSRFSEDTSHYLTLLNKTIRHSSLKKNIFMFHSNLVFPSQLNI